jgi:hypothetical protein
MANVVNSITVNPGEEGPNQVNVLRSLSKKIGYGLFSPDNQTQWRPHLGGGPSDYAERVQLARRK